MSNNNDNNKKDLFIHLDNKLDIIVDKMDNFGVTLAKQEVNLSQQKESLKEHIKRTAILEGKIIPLEKRKSQWDGAFKLIGIISLLSGIASGLLAILHKIGII